ncbi:MAG: D-3-phosphoglycerate dehydrogenase, partial [uncultured Acidimicrobiales bacterium]
MKGTDVPDGEPLGLGQIGRPSEEGPGLLGIVESRAPAQDLECLARELGEVAIVGDRQSPLRQLPRLRRAPLAHRDLRADD